MLNEDEIVLIEDNEFMNVDVSLLIKEDIYLFHIVDYDNYSWLYYFAKGKAFVVSTPDMKIVDQFEYSSGTLSELVKDIV